MLLAFQTAGLRDQVKVITGGDPVTYDFAHKIGAGAHASDASSAVRMICQLLA